MWEELPSHPAAGRTNPAGICSARHPFPQGRGRGAACPSLVAPGRAARSWLGARWMEAASGRGAGVGPWWGMRLPESQSRLWGAGISHVLRDARGCSRCGLLGAAPGVWGRVGMPVGSCAHSSSSQRVPGGDGITIHRPHQEQHPLPPLWLLQVSICGCGGRSLGALLLASAGPAVPALLVA